MFQKITENNWIIKLATGVYPEPKLESANVAEKNLDPNRITRWGTHKNTNKTLERLKILWRTIREMHYFSPAIMLPNPDPPPSSGRDPNFAYSIGPAFISKLASRQGIGQPLIFQKKLFFTSTGVFRR